MSEQLVIALDTMGGDWAPEVVIRGAALAQQRFPKVRFLLYGPEERLKTLLAKHKALQGVSDIVHTESVVRAEDKPSQALRNGRQSSMWQAIEAVRDGRANGVVSAGNTGALMAFAKFVLRTLPGIDRPAIASFFPTLKGESVMLDLGANIQCDANNLVQFAIMGNVFARTVLGIEAPQIGLLNVGSEDVKGDESLREAQSILRDTEFARQYYGFVEGDDIAKGTVEVIVTDGFTGNVVLKAIEGTAKLYAEFLRQTFKSSFLAALGYMIARPALRSLRIRLDPRRYNGAILLGLNGIVVKSHGGTDAFGFANAIAVAVDLVANKSIERIRQDFERLTHRPGPDSEIQSAVV